MTWLKSKCLQYVLSHVAFRSYLQSVVDARIQQALADLSHELKRVEDATNTGSQHSLEGSRCGTNERGILRSDIYSILEERVQISQAETIALAVELMHRSDKTASVEHRTSGRSSDEALVIQQFRPLMMELSSQFSSATKKELNDIYELLGLLLHRIDRLDVRP